MNKYFIIYPRSHQHLGLFKDLENREDVTLITTKYKKLNSKILEYIRKLHTTPIINKVFYVPGKQRWYDNITLDLSNENDRYYIIVFDAAIIGMDPAYFNRLFKKENVHGELMLINSINASSISMLDVRRLIDRFEWENIFSFDTEDVQNYKYTLLPYCYYSKIPEEELENEGLGNVSDVYYIGGMKGNRDKGILGIYEYFSLHNVKTNFNVFLTGINRLRKQKYREHIHYYSGGWVSYRGILQEVLKANVIMEILQEKQNGPSLRYYEAICYNRKLITTNKRAVELPYYKEDYIKIIDKPEDIDIDWVKRREKVDYGYRGDFSPIFLLDIVTK